MCRLVLMLALCLLGLSGPPEVCAQEAGDARAPATEADSLHAPPKWLDRLARVFDFNGPDPRYIRRNTSDFMLMMSHYSSLERYRLRSTGADRQSLTFQPGFNYRIGAYVGWKWLFAGWSVDALDLFGGDSQRSEFSFNIYTAKLGLDLYRIRTDGFRLTGASGFGPGHGLSGTTGSDGLRTESKGINLYYVFNSRYYSQPAAFGQATNQLLSAGSWIGGLSYFTHKIRFDPSALPHGMEHRLSAGLRFGKVRYVDYGINFGYAYNWVFARHWVASMSFSPALGYQYSRLAPREGHGRTRHHKLGYGFIGRLGVNYNNLEHFIGASLVVNKYDYRHTPFRIDNTYALFQVYLGFYFGKEH